MTSYSVTLPGGEVWVPRFVQAVNAGKCIGCGRCFKVCGRDVLQLMGVNEDGELIVVGVDDEDDEYEKKVMTVANGQNCIGCEACARICPKKCYTHAPMPA